MSRRILTEGLPSSSEPNKFRHTTTSASISLHPALYELSCRRNPFTKAKSRRTITRKSESSTPPLPPPHPHRTKSVLSKPNVNLTESMPRLSAHPRKYGTNYASKQMIRKQSIHYAPSYMRSLKASTWR